MKKLILIFVVLLIFGITSLFCQSAKDYSDKGWEYYYQYKYNDAIKSWLLAIELSKETDKKNTGTLYNMIGRSYSNIGKNNEAIKNYTDGLKIRKEIGDKEGEGTSLSNIGTVYYYWGKYDEAVKYYNMSLKVSREIEDKSQEGTTLSNIGTVYYDWGKCNEALIYYNESLKICREIGDKSQEGCTLNNIGMVYYFWCKFDDAVKYYNESLKIRTDLGEKMGVSTTLNNIGTVYISWGKYDEAVKYYNQSLKICREIGDKTQESSTLNNIGEIYDSWDKYEDAIKYFNESLQICRETGDKSLEGINLNNIGHVYNSMDKYDEAIKYYNESLKISKEVGDKAGEGTVLNNIGLIYDYLDKYDDALKYYNESLKICREIGDKSQEGTTLNNIGVLYYYTGRYKESLSFLNNSIIIWEEIRKTAPDETKIDYLASILFTYQWLIRTYIADKNPVMVMNTKEASSARYLVEKLGEKQDIKKIKSINILNFKKKMNNDTIVISYANTNWKYISVLCTTKDKVFAVEVDTTDFVNRMYEKYKNQIDVVEKKLSRRGLILVNTKKNKDQIKEDKTKIKFEMIVNFYRDLLRNPERCIKTVEGKSDFEILSKEFYTLLLKPVEPYMKDKKSLLIIPDRILGFLPFEIFDDSSNKYLIEKYNISYTQSLTVSEILTSRKYSNNKKSFLGFGGAVYEDKDYTNDMNQNEYNLKMLVAALKEKNNIRNTFNSMGISWLNLPETLNEVIDIGKMMKTSKIITKGEVDESNLKSLSKNGALKDYKVIHFATHGFVVPQIPEFSSIVLSQYKNEVNGEDGYLTMREIIQLNLECDFINLSSCETGLGKIVGGEGIVGLTQSFILAGANGISVSLWSVEDESTKEFMIGLYKLVNEKKISYKEAIIEIKRKFIADKKWNSPFFWAPFVYYGK